MKIVFLFGRENIITNYSLVPFYLWDIKNKNKNLNYIIALTI